VCIHQASFAPLSDGVSQVNIPNYKFSSLRTLSFSKVIKSLTIPWSTQNRFVTSQYKSRFMLLMTSGLTYQAM
jgi:hypothetical protein